MVELIQRQQDILARNGKNQMKRDKLGQFKAELTQCDAQIVSVSDRIAALESDLAKLNAQRATIMENIAVGEKTVATLQDESTAELEESLANIEAINAAVAANQQKQNAADEAAEYRAQYTAMSQRLEDVRKKRMALLNDADLPLPGLSVHDGELLYNDKPWDCMSGAEQLKVAVAIVRKLNPNCGFVLMDKFLVH